MSGLRPGECLSGDVDVLLKSDRTDGVDYKRSRQCRKRAAENKEKFTFDEGVIGWLNQTEEVGAASLLRVQQRDATE